MLSHCFNLSSRLSDTTIPTPHLTRKNIAVKNKHNERGEDLTQHRSNRSCPPQSVQKLRQKPCKLTGRGQPWRVRALSVPSPDMEICMFPYVMNVYPHRTWRNMIHPDVLEAGPYPHHTRFRKRRLSAGRVSPHDVGPPEMCQGERTIRLPESVALRADHAPGAGWRQAPSLLKFITGHLNKEFTCLLPGR
jgi:hypothetical protein